MKHVPASLAGLLLVALCAGCETNPYTDRSQLVLLPQSYENSLGEQAYEQVLADPKNRISQDPREVESAKRVAARIIEAAKQSKYAETAKSFEWEVTVVKDDKTANAFALPGGKIAVYTGIYPYAKTEGGLAAVMGHEVVHALARHGAERMSHGLTAQILLTGAAVGLSSQGTPGGQAIMQALGLGTQVGVLLPFSREHESEADRVGIILAAMAGYDPREAIALWQRMEQAGGKQPPEFLSTHPSHETRIKNLQEWMPEALSYYEKATKAEPAPLPGS